MYIGNTKIIELENNLTKSEIKSNLKHVYDVLNKIAKRLYEENIDITKSFLTEKEYKDLKKEHPEKLI